jgi:hypothetical protein
MEETERAGYKLRAWMHVMDDVSLVCENGPDWEERC